MEGNVHWPVVLFQFGTSFDDIIDYVHEKDNLYKFINNIQNCRLDREIQLCHKKINREICEIYFIKKLRNEIRGKHMLEVYTATQQNKGRYDANLNILYNFKLSKANGRNTLKEILRSPDHVISGIPPLIITKKDCELKIF
jgi:hypothetical protein